MSSKKKTAESKKTEGTKPAAKAKPPAGDGKMSGLDAAAKVLAEAKEPMSAKAVVEAVLAKGLWKTKGKTPQATFYAAMTREEKLKGQASRFRRVERGRFALAK